MVKQDSFDVYEGAHDAIVSEEDFKLAQKKRSVHIGRSVKKYSLDHANILTGILKCPCCGDNMYGNINRKKKKSGVVEDRFYYQCKHKRDVDGKVCDYKKSWRQSVIDDAVAEYIMQIIKQPIFEEAIRKKIESRISDDELEIERDDLRKKLKQVQAAKEKASVQLAALQRTIITSRRESDVHNQILRF